MTATFAPRTMTLADDLAWTSGVFTVTLRVKQKGPGNPCSVWVASSSMMLQNQTFSSPPGTKVFEFPEVQPGDTVTTLQIECPAGAGNVHLDWLSIQNGGYEFAPMLDVSSKPSTMGLPGVGRQSVIRASHTADNGVGELMFVGSDVGGFAWSDDGLKWTTANGLAGDWTTGAEFGVWEVWAQDGAFSPELQSVVVLSGHKDSAEGGGLWYTNSLAGIPAGAQAWTKAPGGLGASKHFDDCLTPTFKSIRSGQLIVNQPDDTAGTLFLVASQEPYTRGLWVWDKRPTETLYTPAAPYFTASLPDALPSALAIDSSGEFLLVGYRVIAESGVESAALYVWPSDFGPTPGTDVCQLVSSDADAVWSGDVRDIEAHPTEVVFDATAPSGADWYPLDLSGCALDVTKMRGVAVSRDSRWTFVFGGPHVGGAPGGVCAVDRTDPIDLPDNYVVTEAVAGADMDFNIQSVLAHPHLDDAFYVGGFHEATSTDAPGVYAVERLFDPGTAPWSWEWERLSGNDPEHRSIADLDWGVGEASPPIRMSHLYATAAGGGFWDLGLEME